MTLDPGSKIRKCSLCGRVSVVCRLRYLYWNVGCVRPRSLDGRPSKCHPLSLLLRDGRLCCDGEA
jgi:hypothetical protein